MITAKIKPVTPENMLKMAEDIMDFLNSRNMFNDIIILVNDRFCRSDVYFGRDGYKKAYTKKGTLYLLKEEYDIASHDEWVNPETVTIIMDGSQLSREINGSIDGYDRWVYRALNKKFAYKYGLHFEMPYCYMLTAFKNG